MVKAYLGIEKDESEPFMPMTEMDIQGMVNAMNGR